MIYRSSAHINTACMKLNAMVTMLCILMSGLTPLRALHAQENASACQSTCDTYQASVDFLKADATCQSSSDCKSCLAGVTQNVQLSQYCMANHASKKASNSQIASIATYGAAAAVCATACAFTWAGGDGVCTGATIASGLAEAGLVAILNQDSQNLAQNLFTGALGGAGYGLMANMAGKGMTSLGMHIGDGAGKGVATEGNSNQACAAAGIMTAIAVMKGLNKKKIDESGNVTCKNIEELASKNTALTSCLSQFAPPTHNGSSFASGYGSASESAIIANDDTTIAEVGAGGGVAEEILKSAEKNMKPGMSVADFKKRLKGGESLSKMLSGIVGSSNPGFANQYAALEKQLGADLLSSSGGKQVAGSGATPSQGKEMNFSEIGFGSDAATGSDAQSELSISSNRRIASALNGSDIFHSSYGGTIFQIVSQSLVNQKPNLQALEPVLPLNRALAGLKNESPVEKKKAGKK
jgi:hypothetical protein